MHRTGQAVGERIGDSGNGLGLPGSPYLDCVDANGVTTEAS